MSNMTITLSDARSKAREIHGLGRPDANKTPGVHVADSVVSDLLLQALTGRSGASRAAQAAALDARDLWEPANEPELASRINKVYADDYQPQDEADRRLADAGLVNFQDQYTAERVGNMKSEVLTRFVEGLILPQTPIVNNFFRTVTADPEATIGQLKEFVSYVETLSDWEYYEIDPNRGDIRSVELNFTQASERVNTRMAMYGVKVEYENFLHRVLPNMHVSEIFAMLSVGWAKASAFQREFDASKWLSNYLAPEVAFDNADGASSALGQLTGIGMNGVENGTFNMDYDFPRLQDYMEHDLGMRTDNLIMFLPRNAWSFMNTRKGWRRFLGMDDQPLYQRPNFQAAPKSAFAEDDRYGIRNQGIGHRNPSQAANYLATSRLGKAARAADGGVPGPNAFLPPTIPNLLNAFTLPNTGFGAMRVVLSPHVDAAVRYYPTGHPLRNDDRTGEPRPVMTTDVMFFDGNYPMYLVETIPPTSWTATNDEYRKSMVVMVEAYAMANAARGQQAVVMKNAVLDHNWYHDLTLDADKLKITNTPLSGGTGNPSGLVS